MSSTEWKKKNYNKSIKVSQSVVDDLKKRSKSENIRLANRTDASPQFKEAVRRFYGKSVTGTTRPTGKITPKSRGGATASAGKSVSRGKSGDYGVSAYNAKMSQTARGANKSSSNKSGAKSTEKKMFPATVTPESYKMNVGKDNLTPAQRREIAARQSTRDKIIGTAAQMAVPGTAGFKALKAIKAAKAAKAAKTVKELPAGKPALKQLSAGPKGRTQALARTTTRTSNAVPKNVSNVASVARAKARVQKLEAGMKKGAATKGEVNEAKLMLRAEVQRAMKKAK